MQGTTMQMTTGRKEDRIVWWPFAAAVVVVAVPVACRGYDIGQDFPMPVAWLLGTLAVIMLGAVLLLVLIWHVLRRHWLRAVSCGWVIAAYAALFPPPFTREQSMQEARLGNWVRFLVSYPSVAQPMRTQAPGPDGLVRSYWGGWGFVGAENDTYLVFDAPGRFAVPASHPDGGFGLVCPIVNVQPMLHPWVIVTTSNCTL